MQENAGLTHLFAAYTVVWVVLVGYVARLRQRQKALWKAIERLEDRVGAGSD